MNLSVELVSPENTLQRAYARTKSNVFLSVTCTVFPITRWLGWISYGENWKQEGYIQRLEGPDGSDPLSSLSGRIKVWILRSPEDVLAIGELFGLHLVPESSRECHTVVTDAGGHMCCHRSHLPDHTKFAIKLKNIECSFVFFLIKP